MDLGQGESELLIVIIIVVVVIFAASWGMQTDTFLWFEGRWKKRKEKMDGMVRAKSRIRSTWRRWIRSLHCLCLTTAPAQSKTAKPTHAES
jgi:hypothetical protein